MKSGELENVFRQQFGKVKKRFKKLADNLNISQRLKTGIRNSLEVSRIVESRSRSWRRYSAVWPIIDLAGPKLAISEIIFGLLLMADQFRSLIFILISFVCAKLCYLACYLCVNDHWALDQIGLGQPDKFILMIIFEVN